MINRRFLTPAFLTSLILTLIAAILLTSGLAVLGWIVMIIGLALNVTAVALYANREDLAGR